MTKSRALSIASRAVVFATIVFLMVRFDSLVRELGNWRPESTEVMALVVLSIVYSFSLFFGAQVWHQVVVSLTGIEPPGHDLRRSYSDTQLAKYLPGNIAHLVGRQIRAERVGYERRDLIGAVVAEAIVLCSAALAVGFALAAIDPLEVGAAKGWSMRGMGLIGLAALAAIAPVLRRSTARLRSSVPVWPASVYAIAMFVGHAAIFGATIVLVADTAWSLGLGAVGLAAWTIGYLTPGLPAGAGVRELVLAVALHDVVHDEALVTAIVAYRLVTTAGDVVHAISARMAWRMSDGVLHE